jgi:YHS domain-containing protein
MNLLSLSSTMFRKSFSKQAAVIALLVLPSFAPTMGEAQTARNVGVYNLDGALGLKGYDPVSYFPEGGGVPLVGDAKFQLDYEGVTYRFANQQDLDLFKMAPEKFEPSYGGWCAYAMASGSQVDIQPGIYTIHGNRLHFFVSRRAKANFDADVMGHEVRADGFWKQISGEEPRL